MTDKMSVIWVWEPACVWYGEAAILNDFFPKWERVMIKIDPTVARIVREVTIRFSREDRRWRVAGLNGYGHQVWTADFSDGMMGQAYAVQQRALLPPVEGK